MRTFHLERDSDPSGVSGTGLVAEGAEFTNGKVVLAWLTAVSSVAVYDSMEVMEKVHGHGGATRVVWTVPKGPPPLPGAKKNSRRPPPPPAPRPGPGLKKA